jgi:hypothetical protein
MSVDFELGSAGSGEFSPNTTTNTTEVASVNCTQYSKHYSDIATTLVVSAASISFVACLVVVVLICVMKKHRFLPQRLILYLTVAVMIRCLSWAPQRIHFELVNRYDIPSQTTDKICSVAGYLLMTSGWFELMAVAILTAHLFLHSLVTRSKGWLELVYVLMIFLLPFTFTWIPFIRGAYGQAGSWCWIRIKEDDCKTFTFGVWLRYTIWFVPLILILILLLLFYCIVTYTVSKRNTTWDGNFNPMLRKLKLKMEKDIRPLIWYPLIYFLLHLIPLASRITESVSSRPFYPLWILSAITLPLQGGLIAIAFMLDVKTLRRLRRHVTSGTVRGMTQQTLVEDYPTEHDSEDRSYGESSSFSSDYDEYEYEEGEEGEGHVQRRRGRYTEFTVPDRPS